MATQLKGRAKTWLKVYELTGTLEDKISRLKLSYWDKNRYKKIDKLEERLNVLNARQEQREKLLTDKDKNDINSYYQVVLFEIE